MFFGFSRNETNAFIVLLPFMFILIIFIPVYKQLFRTEPNDFIKEKKELDSIISVWKSTQAKDSIFEIGHATLFEFDPNKATKEELKSLGFTPHLASRIENYRNKGGRFKLKTDLLKIYGMDSALYFRLSKYIELPDNINSTQPDEIKPSSQIRVQNTIEKFNINLADSSQFIRIYGIGSKLSVRIIKYRESLGGYISMNQLFEVYGLDSTVVKELSEKSFIENDFTPKTLSINSATERELASHPYIRYKLAKAITAYRFQHGNFSSLDELMNISVINQTTFNKITPYLSLTP